MAVDLVRKNCLEASSNRLLSEQDVARLRQELSRYWVFENTRSLKRDFKFDNFLEAMVFINDIAAIAAYEEYFPQILVCVDRVTVKLPAQNLAGLSENDFILARKVELCC